jgi:hypothetical protein
MQNQQNIPKIISIFNHKGGVGKTTTTAALGWKLASLGRRVLLVDADPQCNLTGILVAILFYPIHCIAFDILHLLWVHVYCVAFTCVIFTVLFSLYIFTVHHVHCA